MWIYGDSHPGTASQDHRAIYNPLVQIAFGIVGENYRVHFRDHPVEDFDGRLGVSRSAGVDAFPIHANHLLVSGDNAGLDDGLPGGGLLHAIDADSARPQQVQQPLAVGVLPNQAHHAYLFRNFLQVARHVRRAAWETGF